MATDSRVKPEVPLDRRTTRPTQMVHFASLPILKRSLNLLLESLKNVHLLPRLQSGEIPANILFKATDSRVKPEVLLDRRTTRPTQMVHFASLLVLLKCSLNPPQSFKHGLFRRLKSREILVNIQSKAIDSAVRPEAELILHLTQKAPLASILVTLRSFNRMMQSLKSHLFRR